MKGKKIRTNTYEKIDFVNYFISITKTKRVNGVVGSKTRHLYIDLCDSIKQVIKKILVKEKKRFRN